MIRTIGDARPDIASLMCLERTLCDLVHCAEVEASAQRVWHAGTASQLRYFFLVAIRKSRLLTLFPRVWDMILECHNYIFRLLLDLSRHTGPREWGHTGRVKELNGGEQLFTEYLSAGTGAVVSSLPSM